MPSSEITQLEVPKESSTRVREFRVRWKREGDTAWRTKLYQTEKGAIRWAYTVMGYKRDYFSKRFVTEDEPSMVAHYGKIAPLIAIRIECREVSPWAVHYLPLLDVEQQRELARRAVEPEPDYAY